MLSLLKRQFGKIWKYRRLPLAAKREIVADRQGLSAQDPGIDRVVEEGVAWLGRAQDHSWSQDGGVARHFAWSMAGAAPTPRPRVTSCRPCWHMPHARGRGGGCSRRARRMLDWLVSIQFPDGGFQGGLVDSEPKVPVTFNTGQILLGLAGGVRAFGEAYREPMRRAADWLVTTQDPDGCWRRFPTPFAKPGEKAYETHVAWGLLEAARIEGSAGSRYGESGPGQRPLGPRSSAAQRLVREMLSGGRGSGPELTRSATSSAVSSRPTVRKAPALLEAARKTADGLLTAIRANGFLPGRLARTGGGSSPGRA